MNTRPLAALEGKLWEAAEKLRGSLDGAAYRDVVLGVLFLRAAFDPSVLSGKNILVLPGEASFDVLFESRASPDFGGEVDRAFALLERENPDFRGVFPEGFSEVEAERLAAIFELLSEIPKDLEGDLLGNVYEYFLGAFALAEGRRGGEFFTPSSLTRLLASLFRIREGTVFDPAVGAGGLLVEIGRFAETLGDAGELRFVGQESNARTHRLCRMNLALHGRRVEMGSCAADSLGSDLHPDLRADFVVMNPPFNVSRWGGERLASDPKFSFGVPPGKNANFAWIQHALAHLAPEGRAGIFLSNGSLSSRLRAEATIRRRLVEAGRVEAIIQLPAQLFSNTQIAACLWILRGEGSGEKKERETLFIDAERFGRFVSRSQKELPEEEIRRVASVYRKFVDSESPIDEPGFAKSANLKEIAKEGFILTPGRYVGESDASDGVSLPSTEELAQAYLSASRRGRELDEEIARYLSEKRWARGTR